MFLFLLTNVVGQMPDNPADLVSNLIPQLGVLGVLVWFLYYTVKVTIPTLNKENNDTIESIVGHHRLTVADLTTRFDQNLKEERVIRQQEIKDLSDAIRNIHRPHKT